MPDVYEMARRKAPATSVNDSVSQGPWLGSMRSVSPDQVPSEFVASIDATTPSNNFLYLPRSGTWKLRGGASQKFDTFGGYVGLLPDEWLDDPLSNSVGSRCRHMEEFLSDSISDGVPSLISLLTRETPDSTVLDDGRFSNVWIRDQVNSLNYTIGAEYTQTYAAIGTTQTYRIVPLWYESGDGGITRGTTEFLRRFFFCGSRRFLKVGNWWHFPSVKGTPSRWKGRFSSASAAGPATTYTLTSDVNDSQVTDEAGGAAGFADLNTSGDGLWVRWQNDSGSRTATWALSATIADNKVYTITYSAKNETATPNASTYVQFAIICSGTERYASAQIFPATAWTSTFATYTTTVNCNGTNGAGSFTANSIEIGESASVGTGSYSAIDYVVASIGDADVADNANYLFPTGPFPPTHCGSVTANSPSTTTYMRPDGNIAGGSWTVVGAASIYEAIDEATSDAFYVRSNSSNTSFEVTLANPASTPTIADTITVRYQLSNVVLSGYNVINVYLVEDSGPSFGGGTTIAANGTTFNSSTGVTSYNFSLTDTQIAAVTNWNNLKLRFTSVSESGSDEGYVWQAFVEIVPADTEGGWKGKDRFMRAFYYRYEDDSIWALTQPRFPNTTLSTGLDLVTVASGSPETSYASITHTNIPIGPVGVKAIGICRGDKIDSTVDDNLLINPTGMKLIAEVPNGTTSYIDYSGDDSALVLDVEQYFIRYDHIMAPRTKYIFGGDQRVGVSYGGTNPCAIVIAPVGRTADYDLNLADSAAALYTSHGSWMQVALATDGTGTLTLIQGDGATATDTESFAFATYNTLQKLVDGINATNCAGDGQQWRAQLCPGASPDAVPATALTPHNRAIASCVINNTAKTITKAAGGLSKVAVGQLASGAAEEGGAYITSVTDTALVYTGTLTTGTETLYFYNNIGDSHITDPDTSALGFQRVISNSLPAFLYFNKTYLDTQTFDKSATWTTVANPGSMKAAPNCFSGKIANRFTPPLGAGICMGGAAVDNGFVVLYGNKVGAIRPRGPDSFLDQDYGLTILDETRGCCAWNTITPGNRFVPFLSAEGMFAADLQDVKLISSDIYVDQPAALGDFSYEGPQSVAATAADTDGSYAWARIARGVLWVGYRTSASTTLTNRMVRLDFSTGDEATGLRALFRKPGVTWGWSVPLAHTDPYSMLCEGRRTDGLHLYAWNEENEGTTGDGRIDEIETGTTDNGVAYTGRIEMPWIRPPNGELISAQEMILEHSSPAGSTGSLVFHRTFADDSYTLTPGTSSLGVYSELKFLPQGARANANAGFVDYRQATGSARELRKLVLKFKRIQRFKT